MTSITASLPAYTPPPATTSPAPTPAADSGSDKPAAPTAPATNANENAPAIYTSVASTSTSNIRGTSVNTTA